MHTLLDKKLKQFSSFLNITPDAFDSKNVKSKEEFVEAVIHLFVQMPNLFNSFLFRIFDWRIKTVSKASFSTLDSDNVGSFKDIVNSGQLNTWLRNLQAETGLVFPRPVLSTASYFVQLLLVLVPLVLSIIALVFNFGLLLPIYGLFKVGVLLLIIVVPYLVASFMFPNFFRPNKLPKIVSYRDLVDQVVWLNRYDFIEDDYKMTRSELEKIFESL